MLERTTDNQPADDARMAAELARRLPHLAPAIGIRHGDETGHGGGPGCRWLPLPRRPALAVAVPGDCPPGTAAQVAELIDDTADDLAAIDSLCAALLDSYDDLALTDELGRRLPTCAEAQAVAALLADTLAQRHPSSGLIVLGEDGAWTTCAHWGSATDQDLDAATAALIDDREQPRILAVPALPTALDPAQAPGCLCLAPLNAAGGRRGLIVLGHRKSQAFTSRDAKILEIIGAQGGAYLQHLAQQQALRAAADLRLEMDLAARIQQQLLPRNHAELPGCDVAGSLRTAQQVGGDYFDHLWDGQRLHLIIADVSGHNLAAALTMAMVRTALRTALADHPGPGALLATVNRLLCDDLLRARQFVSVAAISYEPPTGHFTLAIAGHPPVLHRRHDGHIIRQAGDGPVLGLFPKADFAEQDGQLAPGDSLLLYTDGLTETLDGAGQPFGDDRLDAVVRGCTGDAQQLITSLLAAQATHRHLDDLDDLTLLALHRQ